VTGEHTGLISIVMPVFNEEEHLGHQLAAISAQRSDRDWELIVADNGSTDESTSIEASWADRDPRIRVIDASGRRGPSAARNIGVAAARGDTLVFCDADDVVAPGWLEAMSRALDRHEFVTGNLDFSSLNPDQPHRPPKRTGYPAALGFRPSATTVNMGVSRAVFDKVGGFDETLEFGEDPDFSWRVLEHDVDLADAPDAIVAYRLRDQAPAVWRQQVAWGRSEVALFKRWATAGMPRRTWRAVGRDYVSLLARVRVLYRPAARLAWVRDAARRWGRVRGSIRQGVRYL
jgi:glycosyltransferase involved in cell wall biosynthesis